MLRWNDVADATIFGRTVKMYREPYAATETITSVYSKLELDHYAFKYFGSELFMYRVLDINFEQYMEERGDLDRIKDIVIVTVQDTENTVL